MQIQCFELENYNRLVPFAITMREGIMEVDANVQRVELFFCNGVYISFDTTMFKTISIFDTCTRYWFIKSQPCDIHTIQNNEISLSTMLKTIIDTPLHHIPNIHEKRSALSIESRSSEKSYDEEKDIVKACAHFADHVFADHVFADHVFADHVFADHVFADHVFADHAFANDVE